MIITQVKYIKRPEWCMFILSFPTGCQGFLRYDVKMGFKAQEGVTREGYKYHSTIERGYRVTTCDPKETSWQKKLIKQLDKVF